MKKIKTLLFYILAVPIIFIAKVIFEGYQVWYFKNTYGKWLKNSAVKPTENSGNNRDDDGGKA